MGTQHKVAVVDYTPTSTAKTFEAYPPRTSLGGEDFVHCWAMEGTR